LRCSPRLRAARGRALYLQALETEFLQGKGDARYSRLIEVPATRGRIVDRRGDALAISTPVKSIWAIPGDVELSAAERRKLAALLGLETRELQKKLDESARDFVYLKRQLSPDTADAVAALGLKGIYQHREFRRYYPGGEVTAHLVGFTGWTMPARRASSWRSSRISREPRDARVLKDRLGRVVEDVESIRSAQDGRDLALSIDGKLQSLAFGALQSAVELHRAKAGA
jgi:cell division protein FtsI (penicillin-binding protein 3)